MPLKEKMLNSILSLSSQVLTFKSDKEKVMMKKGGKEGREGDRKETEGERKGRRDNKKKEHEKKETKEIERNNIISLSNPRHQHRSWKYCPPVIKVQYCIKVFVQTLVV